MLTMKYNGLNSKMKKKTTHQILETSVTPIICAIVTIRSNIKYITPTQSKNSIKERLNNISYANENYLSLNQ